MKIDIKSSILLRIVGISLIPTIIVVLYVGFSIYQQIKVTDLIAKDFASDILTKTEEKVLKDSTTLHNRRGFGYQNMQRLALSRGRFSRYAINSLSHTLSFVIVFNGKNIIYATPPRILLNKDIVNAIYKNISSKKDDVSFFNLYTDNTKWLIKYKLIPQKDIIIAAAVNVEKLTSPFKNHFKTYTDALILLAIASIASIVVMIKYLIIPIKELSYKINLISQGDYESILKEEPKKYKGEIAYLNNAIYEMAQRITTYLGFLKDYIGNLLRAKEEEKNIISMEIHDTILQELTGAVQKTELLLFKLDKSNALTTQELKSYLSQINNLLKESVNKLRDICNLLKKPPENESLFDAIEYLTEKLQSKYNAKELKIHLDFQGNDKGIDAETYITVYRSIQEAITNIIKHAKAKNVWIFLTITEKDLTLSIKDDGVGFDIPDNLYNFVKSNHMGLFNIKERALMLGGKFYISSDKNKGTTIKITLPLSLKPKFA